MAKQLNQIKVDLTFGADTSQVKKQLQDLQKILQDIAKMPGRPENLLDDKSIKEASKAAMELQRHLSAAMNVNTGNLDLSRFSASLRKGGQSLDYYYDKLSAIGPTGTKAFLTLSQNIASAEAPTARLNAKMTEFLTTLKNTARWQISSSILHGFMGTLQSAYGYAQDLNKSLNDIRIVTGQSTEQMAEFAKRANESAKALSSTTTAYTDAALIFYQQGLDDKAVQERTDAVIKMSNVTGEAVKDVSSYMTAIWNNFDDGSESLEHYADVITALGAATASSSEEIANGLEKFASIGKTVGLSYDYATAALATVVASTRQSEDVVGTAFKTIFSRIQGLKLGETLEDDVDLNKYSSALKAVGVEVINASGELRDLDDILDDLADKWDLLTSAQQTALAQTVAGTRQYAQFIALMSNWDFMEQNLEVARNSEGSLQKQADIYAQSWEAARKKVKASAEDLYQSLLDDKFFIKITNDFAKLIDVIKSFADTIGGLKGILTSIGGIFLTIYAKQWPAALENLKNNFLVFTGQATKLQAQVQDSFQNKLNDISKNNNFSLSEKVELESVQQLFKMKQKLLLVSEQLTEEEKSAYQQKIDNVQLMYKETIAIAKQAEEIDERIKKIKESVVAEQQAYVSGVLSDYSDNVNKQKYLENKIATSKNDEEKSYYEKVLDKTKQEAIELEAELYNIQETFNRLEEEGAKKLNIDNFIEDPSRNNINTIMQNYGLATKDSANTIDKLITKYQELNVQSTKLTKIDDAIAGQLQEWGKIPPNIQESSKVLQSYMTQLKELGALTDEQENEIITYIGDVSKKSGYKVDSIIEGLKKLQGSINFSDIDKELDEVLGKLRALGVAPDTLNKIIQDIDNFSEKVGDMDQSLSNVQERADDNVDSVNHFSSTLSQVTGTAMMTSTAITSCANAITILEDSSASAQEKMGAIMTMLSSIGMLASSVGPMLKNLATNLKNATTASEGLKASLASNPYGWIALAIGAVVAGLTLYYNHVKNVADAEDELADKGLEKVQKKLDSINEHIDKISELSDEYDILTNKYEKNEISLSDLKDETYLLCQKYGLQHEALQVLASDYEDINELINKNIKIAANQEIINEQDNYRNALQDKIISQQKESNTGRSFGDYFYSIDGKWLGPRKNISQFATDGSLQFNTGQTTSEEEEAFFNDLMGVIGSSLKLKDFESAVPSSTFGVLDNGISGSVTFEGFEDAIAENWDEIQEILDQYGKEISNNNIYKTFQKYFEGISEDVLNYKEYLGTVDTAKLENIGLENYDEGSIKNYESYQQTRDKLIREATFEGFFDYTEEGRKNAIQWANGFLSQYEEAKQYISEYNYTEAIRDQFNADGTTVNAFMESFKTAATQTATETVIDTYKNALQEINDKGLSDELRSQMEAIAPEDFDWESFDESSKIEQIQLINELLLAQNNLIIANAEAQQKADEEAAAARDRQREELENQLGNKDTGTGLYTERTKLLQQLADDERLLELAKNNNPDADTSAFEKNIEEDKELLTELEEKIKDVEEAIENLKEQDFDFKFDGIEEASKVLDNLVDSILSGAEAFQSAAELIGEGFTVAAENVDELNALFPALLENATVADDGIVTLNEEVVQSYLNGYDEILKANTEETANQLRNEIAIVDAELEFQQTKMNIIAETLAGKKSAADAEQEIAYATGEFESKVYNEVLKVDVENAQKGNEAHATVTNDQLSFLDTIDNRIAEVSAHFAKMLSGQVVYAGSSTPVSASLVTGYVPTVYEGPVAESWSSDEIDKLQSEYTEAANRVNELTRLRGDLVEDLSNLLAGSSNASSALQGAASGAGGKTDKSKGSGSKKQKETKELKEFFDEFDQFYPLTKAIEDVTDALNDLGKQQEHLSGQNLINSLKKQNDLLQKQHKIYRDLIKQQQDYRDSLAGMLQSFGATFDAETGNISNYMELTATNLQKYNEAVITYNNSAQDEAAKKALSLAERNYKAFKDYLSKYQKILTEIEDTQNNLDDILYEQIENNFKAFEVDIQLDLDLEEARRQINDFIRDINVDFRKAFKSTKEWADLFDVAAKNSKTYSEAGGTIDTDLKKLREIAEIIDNSDYNYMTPDSMFADRTEAIKAYKDASDQLMKDGKDFYELYKSSWDSYLDAIDEADKQWDDMIKGYDKINKTLDHYQKITELLYDEESDLGREYLDQLYEVSAQTSLAEQEVLKTRIASLQKEYDEILAMGGNESEEDLRKIAEQIEDANDELNSQIESYLQTIQDQLINSIHSIMSTADKAMTQGYGIQTISQRWQDAQDAAEGYYDDVQRIYQLQKAENSWQDLINSTKNLKTQQYLKGIMDSQLENLKSKTKLSEYDVQLAEKELEVQRAYVALQDSQNNKNLMKLVRNKQGNWSYQYVADQDDVANKQQNFLDALNEKYTFTKEQSEKAVESLMNLYTEANDRLTSLLEEYKYADEDRRAKIKEEYNYLYETYYGSEGLIAQKAQECSDMQNYIAYTMMQSLEGHYEVNKTNFENMTIAQQELFGKLRDSGITDFKDLSLKLGNKDAEDTIYGGIYKNAKEAIDEQDGEWKTLAKNIVVSWGGEENSVSAVIQDVYDAAMTKVQEYDDKIKKSEFASGQNWTDVKTEGDKAAASIADINKQLDELLAKNDALSTYKGIVDSIGTQWDGVKNSIEKATKATEDYLEALREPSEVTKPDYVEDVNPQGEYNAGTSGGSGGGGGKSGGSGGGAENGGSSGGPSEDTKIDELVFDFSGSRGSSTKYYQYEDGTKEIIGGTSEVNTSKTNKKDRVTEAQEGRQNAINQSYNQQKAAIQEAVQSVEELKNKTLSFGATHLLGYATGGYTGDWNSTDGRLAILHEKELVLNKEDTSNILDAVNMVRGISNLSSLVSNVISSNLAGMALGLSGLSPNGVNANTTSNSNNIFNITAEFPNAENVNEIREAILSLPTLASQYLSQR